MLDSPTLASLMTLPSRFGSLLIFGLLSTVGACASTEVSPTPPPSEANHSLEISPNQDAATPAQLTAVLLFANETNTVDAPEILRNFMANELTHRGFKLQPLDETASLLRDQLQISDGGQLPAVDPKQVGEALGGVGTLFYGDVLEWKKLTTGVYNTASVKATFKLVESKTGAVLWERTHEVQKKIDLKIGNNLGADILAGAIMNLFLNPMTPYAGQLAREVGRQLPHAPVGIPQEAIPFGDIPQGDLR
jgi:hypothetical protein